MKFKELKAVLGRFDLLSICDYKTLNYTNYKSKNDVPAEFDDKIVKGVGIIESEFYGENKIDCSPNPDEGNLLILPCIEIVLLSQDELQDISDCNKIGIGSIVKIIEEDSVGIVKDIQSDVNIDVDIYYQKDDYLVPFHQKNVNCKDIILADDNDYRVAFLTYLSRRNYLHIYSKRDKERMSAVLHQVKKAWETYPDLRLGQLLMGCCANDSVMFGIEDEMLMENLHKVFLDKDKSTDAT